MSSLKDKKLLLLGILQNQSTHGYKLNEFLKMPGNVIKIGKANAYKLLGKLQEDGFVSSHEERNHNYPLRLVYSITPKGEKELHRLLRERLAEHYPSEYPDGVSLNLIGLIEPEESLSFLEERQARLADRCESLKIFSDDIRALHPGLDFIVRQTSLEYEFISELILKLKQEKRT